MTKMVGGKGTPIPESERRKITQEDIDEMIADGIDDPLMRDEDSESQK